MSVPIQELINLSSEVYRKKIWDAPALHNIIIKCKVLLIAKKILDDTGNFTRFFNHEQEIEVKKIVELLGYCYFLVMDYANAFKVYQELVLSDCTPFNAWKENIPLRDIKDYYLELQEGHAHILQLLEKGVSHPEKSELYRELYSHYFTLGYYSLAAKNLEKYLLAEPTDFEYWYLLVEYYEYKENYPKAIECVENAIHYALSEGYPGEAEEYQEKLTELRNMQK